MPKKAFLSLILIIIISCGVGCGQWLSSSGTVSGTVYPGGEQSTALPDPGISSLSLSLNQRATVNRNTPAKIDSLIVTCSAKLSELEQQQSLRSWGFNVVRQLYSDSNTYVIKPLNSISIEETYQLAKNTPFIESVEYNYPLSAMAAPNEQLYSERQWDMMVTKFNICWDNNYRGQAPVVVAILDTGINVDSVELKDRMVPTSDWHDFVYNDQDPRDSVPTPTPTLLPPQYQYSHGTNVAGIIGAKPNNGIGYAGAAWDENIIKIMPVRVLNTYGEGDFGTITDGIYWAVNHNAKVINLSLGGEARYNWEPLNNAFAYAGSHNVTIVCASGNEDTAVDYPARLASSHSNVIAVGATGYYNSQAFYSCYGPELTVVAPGGDSTVSSSSFQQYIWNITYDKYNQIEFYDKEFQGTSMATPHVSALAAMLYSYGVTDPAKVRDFIRYTATDLGTPGRDNYYGYGLINAYAAMLGATYITSITVGLRDPITLKDVTTPVHPDHSGFYRFLNISAGNYELYARCDLPNGYKYDGTVPVTVTTSGTLFTVAKKDIFLPLLP